MFNAKLALQACSGMRAAWAIIAFAESGNAELNGIYLLRQNPMAFHQLAQGFKRGKVEGLL